MAAIITNDTIAAISTPPGQGGIAVIRVSGPRAESVLRAVFRRSDHGQSWVSHQLVHGHICYENETIDEALAVLMRSPRSYTREHIAELHVHGGSASARRTLDAVLSLGVRAAHPGEFTRRAFENGRIDLAQAEAAMRLISASCDAAAREAVRALFGGTSKFIKDAQAQLVDLLASLEAAIDFPDEVEESVTAPEAAAQARALREKLEKSCDLRAGRVIENGLNAVIAGAPNAGKSSLMNALLGEERAIVHVAPGTTRDVLTARLTLAGVCVNLSDTAGLRRSGDPVEAIGVERAQSRIAGADLVLFVVDSSAPPPDDLPNALKNTVPGRRAIILNKCDLPSHAAIEGISALAPEAPCVRVSALNGTGLESVRSVVESAAMEITSESAELTAIRHIDAAREAMASLADAERCLSGGCGGDRISLAIIDLNSALRALCGITGESADEFVIDAVFSNFCVGK